MELHDARILITGGGSGIGLATAAQLSARGARLVLCGRRPDVLARAAETVGAVGIPCDVSDEASVASLFARTNEELGGLDVLLNNAAFGYFAKLVEQESERFDALFATNVRGAMLCGRAAARRFIEQGGGGTIVNVGSTAARKGFPGGTAYAASKFALSGMTECWRAELRPHDIRVMQVDPSEVQTPFGRGEGAAVNPTKLVADDVAHVIVSLLELDDRGFIPETTIWATNPR